MVWESSAGRAIREVTEDILLDNPTEFELMFAAKYGQALLSAFRDIVNLGIVLEEELVAAEQTRRADITDLRLRAAARCDRCLALANDPKLDMDGPQRRAFRAAPQSASAGELAVAVESNLTALKAVRDLLEP